MNLQTVDNFACYKIKYYPLCTSTKQQGYCTWVFFASTFTDSTAYYYILFFLYQIKLSHFCGCTLLTYSQIQMLTFGMCSSLCKVYFRLENTVWSILAPPSDISHSLLHVTENTCTILSIFSVFCFASLTPFHVLAPKGKQLQGQESTASFNEEQRMGQDKKLVLVLQS